MSKLQGDSYKTETNKSLNTYYFNVFRPALLKMEDKQIKKYSIGNFIIECEQKNIVERDGWKLKSLKIVSKEYTIRVFLDIEYNNGNGICRSVDFTDNKDEANKMFKEKVEMCKICEK